MMPKPVAVFMIMLVVSLPVYSAAVMGGSTLWVNKISGSDGYGNQEQGYRKYLDETHVEVTAQIDDEEVATSNVRLSIEGSGNIPFTSCEGSGVGALTNCEFTYPSNVEGYMTPGTHSVMVKLQDSEGSTLRTSDHLAISVDNKAPAVESFSISPKLSAGTVTLSIDAADYAHTTGDTSRCVGIKRVDVYEGDLSGPVVLTKDYEEMFVCEASIQEEYTSSLGSGEARLCVKAIDHFDQESSGSDCDTFEIDANAPTAEEAELLRADNDKPLRNVAEDAIAAKLVIRLSGTDIVQGSVKADLTELNDVQGLGTRAPDSITVENGMTMARWALSVQLTATKSPVVKLYGEDAAGNPISPEQVSLDQIRYDTEGPVVTSLRTEPGEVDGFWMIGKEGKFIAEVTENEGNLENHEIYLDLHDLGLGVVKATNCTEGYVCTWDISGVTAQSGTVAQVGTTLNSQDDLGNKATESLSIEVKVDSSAPEVEMINITAIHGSSAVPSADYFVKGDKLLITALASDESEVSAYGNFSDAITSDDWVPGTCSHQEDELWECTWETNPIDKSGPSHPWLKFTFKDFVGNTEIVAERLNLSGLNNETDPNYWSSTVTCTPRLIDRQVTTLVEQRVYCNVHLNPLIGGIEPISIGFDQNNCRGLDKSLDYVRDIKLLNAHPGSTDPYLKIRLKTTEFEVNELEFMCPLSIITRVNTAQGPFIVQNPEYENASMTLQFYNLPLGQYANAVQAKIDDVKDNSFVKLTWISSLEKMLNFAETMCGLINTWNNIVTVLNTISGALGTVATAIPAAKPVALKWRYGVESTGKFKDGFQKTVYKLCMYVSCDATLWGAWYHGYVEKWNNENDHTSYWKPYTNGGGGSGVASSDLGWDWFSNQKIGGAWPENPKDSVILSLATGCLPGIIDGVQRWRQIQCNYGVCLRDSAEQMIPIKVCEDQKAYLECKFLAGEIFQIMPFAHAFKSALNKLTSILSDPLGFIFGAVTYVCTPKLPDDILHPLCIFFATVKNIIHIIRDLDNAQASISNKFRPSVDMCEELGVDGES